MDQVAQRAGVSKQTVYSHVASKEALFTACICAKVAGCGFDETTEVDDTDLRAALSALTRRFVDLLFDPEVIAMHRLERGESASQTQRAANRRSRACRSHRFPAAGVDTGARTGRLDTLTTKNGEIFRPTPGGRGLLWLLFCLLMPGYAASAGPPDGAAIAREVDFVNRFGALANVSYGTDGRPVVLLDLAASGRLVTNTFERWRRNDYPEGAIAARDLVIFLSGKLRGTGILVTDFSDPGRDRS